MHVTSDVSTVLVRSGPLLFKPENTIIKYALRRSVCKKKIVIDVICLNPNLIASLEVLHVGFLPTILPMLYNLHSFSPCTFVHYMFCPLSLSWADKALCSSWRESAVLHRVCSVVKYNWPSLHGSLVMFVSVSKIISTLHILVFLGSGRQKNWVVKHEQSCKMSIGELSQPFYVFCLAAWNS